MRIRKIQKSDIPNIIDIIKKTLSGIDAQKAKKDLIDQLRKLYVEGENFVAEDNGRIAGTIGYWRLNHHPKDIAWLDWFVVDKRYQNKGVGSELLRYMLKILKRKNKKILCCEVSSKATSKSKKFYKHHRFKKCGVIKEYWEDGGNLFIFVKSINQIHKKRRDKKP